MVPLHEKADSEIASNNLPISMRPNNTESVYRTSNEPPIFDEASKW